MGVSSRLARNLNLMQKIIYIYPAAKGSVFTGSMILTSLMEKLDSVQYSAARAMLGTWRGTSREKLYTELGLKDAED